MSVSSFIDISPRNKEIWPKFRSNLSTKGRDISRHVKQVLMDGRRMDSIPENTTLPPAQSSVAKA